MPSCAALPDRAAKAAGGLRYGQWFLPKRVDVHLLEFLQVPWRYDVGVESSFFERTSDLQQNIALHRKAENAPPLTHGPIERACDDLDLSRLEAMLAAETLRDYKAAVSLRFGKFRKGQDRGHDERPFEGHADEGRGQCPCGVNSRQNAIDRLAKREGASGRCESGDGLGFLTAAPAGTMPSAMDLTGADPKETGRSPHSGYPHHFGKRGYERPRLAERSLPHIPQSVIIRISAATVRPE